MYPPAQFGVKERLWNELSTYIDEYHEVETAHRAGNATHRELYESEALVLGAALRWKRGTA
jgi:hypothetical protein